MNIFKKISTLSVLVICFGLGLTSQVMAATAPTLVDSAGYSVLGGQAVTNTGPTVTNGAVGATPLTSVTGFPPGIAGGGVHINDASAIAAEADSLTAFGTLDQTCTTTYVASQDLTLVSPLPPGVYCDSSSFTLSGNLTLSGSGVWIFKTVSTLITSSGSSVTGAAPCNVWWRIGSSATLATTTAFTGTIIAQNGVNAMNTGATLNGRLLTLSAATVTLNDNTITNTNCVVASVPKLPNTGIAPKVQTNYLWQDLVATGTIALVFSLYLSSKRNSLKL